MPKRKSSSGMDKDTKAAPRERGAAPLSAILTSGARYLVAAPPAGVLLIGPGLADRGVTLELPARGVALDPLIPLSLPQFVPVSPKPRSLVP